MAVPCEMLLHPELLSNEQLLCVIQDRHLKIPNIQNMPRDMLLELFHNYCVPYGQRKYRDSGRGKALNKSRHTSLEAGPKLDVINNCPSRKMKPPPDLLSGHMKKIKLDTQNIQVTMDITSTKRKMVIDTVMASESPPAKKERKLIVWP